MLSRHPCLRTYIKILACLATAVFLTFLTCYLINKYHKDPDVTTAPPTCLLDCKNGGVCENNQCRCPDKYTGDLCTKENFCRSFTNCTNQECFTFGDILIGMYGYSYETCNATDVNANTPRATIQCRIIDGNPANGSIILQNCNQNLQTLANMTDVNTANAQEIAVTTQILTSESEKLQAKDISNAITIVNRILNVSQNSTEEEVVVASAVTTVSQILRANATEFETVSKEAESLTRSMEALSVSNNSNEALSVVQPSVAIEKRQLSTRSTNGISFMSLRGIAGEEDLASSRVIVNNDTSEFVLNETAEVHIFIKPVDNSDVNATVGFVLYQNDNLFTSQHKKNLKYAKRIISASISEGVHANVEFSFNQQFDPSYSLVEYACVFWDYERSEWNTTGCQKKLSTDITSNETTSNNFPSLQCACNHTTNFAVLMKFKENIDYATLDTVSTIGCTLSILGLSITVVFLLYARRKKHISWILMSLCTSMLIFYIIFVAAMEISQEGSRDKNNETINYSENIFFFSDLAHMFDGICTALAALQHYFLLTTFALTAMLGTEFCFRLIFITHVLPQHFTMSALIIGWGLPALIVFIAIGATYPGTNDYNRKEFCWLVAENKNKQLDPAKPMMWSFLLPVGIILIANICIVIAVAVLSIWKRNPALTSTRRTSILKKTLAIFSVASLLGITWVFGYLTLIETDDNTHIIFSFIFCICGSTQGLQIFIFYTLRSPIFLKKIAAAIRLFKSCKVYMHSETYWVNRIQNKAVGRYRERFRKLSDSTDGLFSDNNEPKE